MSTRILTGFKIDASGMAELLKACKFWRQEMVQRAQNYMLAEIAKTIAHWNDLEAIGQKVFVQDNRWKQLKDHLFTEIKRLEEGKSNPPFDYGAEVVFFPTETGKIYGMYFCVNNSIVEPLLNDDRVKDFHYQDQMDKPEGVSEQEWNKRKEVWDEIFPKTDTIPSENGFTFTLVRTVDYYPDYLTGFFGYKITDYLPVFEERLRAVAEEIVLQKSLKLRKKQLGRELQYSEVAEIVRNRPVAEINAAKEEFRPYLPGSYSVGDLFNIE